MAYWDTFDGQAIRVLEGSEEGEITTLSVSLLGGASEKELGAVDGGLSQNSDIYIYNMYTICIYIKPIYIYMKCQKKYIYIRFAVSVAILAQAFPGHKLPLAACGIQEP